MRIALTGGVFEDPMGAYALSAPETVLRRFLGELGHEVVPLSSGRPVPLAVPADVWHANHFGVAAYHLALARVRPLVFTSHNPFLVSDYDEDESRLEHALEALVLRRADAVVALSRREAALLAERFEIPPEKFAVIPTGLDLALYGSREEPPRDGIELLSVGQLADYKGHDYLLEALATLVPRLPGLRLRIVTHRLALRERYERRCRALGVADRVTFEGPLATPELVERYRACDVYVQPSLAECFPVTVLEAMACGKPVVATDVGGVAEEVGDAGVIVPARDFAALAAAIEQLVSNREERRQRGQRALARARELYDGRRVAKRHAELYAELAERRRRPPLVSRLGACALLAAYGRRHSIARFIPERVRRRETKG